MQLFDRFWWNLARWRILAFYSGKAVKILNFWKFKMAAADMMKIKKIAIYPQRFDRSLRNLIRWCKMGLLTAPTGKNIEFHKSKMAPAAILRTVKSPYLCSRLTDFDEIWHDDALLAPYSRKTIKISKFWKFKMEAATICKNHNISVTVWPIFSKFGTLMQNGSLN